VLDSTGVGAKIFHLASTPIDRIAPLRQDTVRLERQLRHQFAEMHRIQQMVAGPENR
jgi:hypothetical protein